VDGIDLSLLYESIMPMKQLQGEDGSWDPDVMLEVLKQEMQEEQDRRVRLLEKNYLSIYVRHKYRHTHTQTHTHLSFENNIIYHKCFAQLLGALQVLDPLKPDTLLPVRR